jgi:hypothetical protein
MTANTKQVSARAARAAKNANANAKIATNAKRATSRKPATAAKKKYVPVLIGRRSYEIKIPGVGTVPAQTKKSTRTRKPAAAKKINGAAIIDMEFSFPEVDALIAGYFEMLNDKWISDNDRKVADSLYIARNEKQDADKGIMLRGDHHTFFSARRALSAVPKKDARNIATSLVYSRLVAAEEQSEFPKGCHCKYCGAKTAVSMFKQNHGACHKPACVLSAMRDSL